MVRAARSRVRKRFVAAFVVGAGLFAVATNAAADVQACLGASEKGQRARAAGKLREAREQFLVCGADACPGLVRKDCIHWNTEIAASLPTVVFGAKDKQGRDLFDVTVSMESEVLVKKLDGKSVTIDPGKHTFKFESSGLPAQTETVLVKEGERARNISVVFENPAPVTTAATSSGGGDDKTDKADKTDKPDKADKADAPPQEGGHTPYPWIVVGVGVATVVVGGAIALSSPSRPPNCNQATQTCSKQQNESDAQFVADQQRAGTADSQPILGLAVAGIGIALVAGGLLWHFLEPTTTEAKPAAQARLPFRVAPFTTGTSSGLVAAGTF
jgi:hypothetical protein